ncbi:MAG: SPFH domain-containing protein [Myxococcota bacterium]
MSQFIEVIECLDRSLETIVSRFPEQGSADIKLGAQLIVRESQAAIFVRDGRALDTFGAGRHTLTTMNVPLLTKALSLPMGGQSPFRAEVYFANLRTFVNQKWGTMEPILFRDSELDMVRLRAFGIYSFRITNAQVFLNSLVGTVGEFTTDALADFFRGLIVTQVAEFLGSHLHTVLDLAQHYVEISAGIQAHVLADFEKYGVTVADFKVLSISPPDHVQEMIDKRGGMAAVGSLDKFVRYQAANALEKSAAGGGGSGLAAAGVGAGAGLGLGAGMAGVVTRALGGSPATSQCSACGFGLSADANFCSSCGARQRAEAIPCPSCNTANPSGSRFCASCGTALGRPAPSAT